MSARRIPPNPTETTTSRATWAPRPSPFWCSICERDLTKDDFTYRRNGERSGYCRPCQAAKHKAWRESPEGKAAQSRHAAKSRAKHPEKKKARNALSQEIRMGRIKRGPCALENGQCSGRIEGHHHDYSRPFDVVWLCQYHHRVAEERAA